MLRWFCLSGERVRLDSDPPTNGSSAPTEEIGTTISPRQIVRGPDLGCPTGSDSACGNGNVALSPSLDTENNAPLGAVAGIEKIAEAGQMVPGLNVPATILKSAIDLGQGEIGEACLNTAGLIPFGSLFRRGHRFINAVDKVADGVRTAIPMLNAAPARLTQEGLEHIVKRHWTTSGTPNLGKFWTEQTSVR
ncbi:MAG: hypothetical protein IPK58_24055 [Acidobacteria bacterium]|nr:hypothetical protein [Acidobacteriota bacterium]